MELAALNPDKDSAGDTSSARRVSASGSRRGTLFGRSMGMGTENVEEIVGRVLSERGVVLSLITVKDLVEKFGRHEQSIGELYEKTAKLEKGNI